jgi:hypothetical protein
VSESSKIPLIVRTNPEKRGVFRRIFSFHGRMIASVIVSLLCLAYSQVSIYQFIDTSIVIDAGLFVLMIVLEVPLIVGMRHESSTRMWVFAACLSTVIASLLIAGMQLQSQSMILWQASTVCYIFFNLIPIMTTIAIFLCNFENRTLKQREIRRSWLLKHRRILIFTVILIFWILGYLALFPGVYDYDAGNKIVQFRDPSIGVGNDYAVLHSAILNFLVWLGESLFNSSQIGFGIYILLQLLFMVYVCTEISCYLYDRFKNVVLLAVTIIFFVLFFHLMVIALSSYQDTIFAGIFALIVLRAIRMAENPKLFFSKWHQPIIFAALILLLCMFRNNGFYALLVAVPFFVVLMKKFRIKTLIVLLVPLIIFQVYSGPILGGLGVKKDPSIKEMLSIPLQQLARVYTFRADGMTPDQRAYLQELVPSKNLDIYYSNPSISDQQKEVLNTDLLESSYSKFIGLYLKVGIQNPRTYVDAALMNTLGYWYPTKSYPDPRMYHPYLEYNMIDYNMPWLPEKVVKINRTSLFPPYEQLLNVLVHQNVLTDTPIVSIFYTMGSYFLLFLFLITLILYRRTYKLLAPVSLLFGLYLTILLGPVALLRYAYPILLCVPLIVGMMFLTNASTKPVLEDNEPLGEG